MFRNQGPDYYGDNDEMDANLAAEEDAAQRQGTPTLNAPGAPLLTFFFRMGEGRT
jgi:hypothetical protein